MESSISANRIVSDRECAQAEGDEWPGVCSGLVAGTLPLNTMAETLNYRPSTDNWYAMGSRVSCAA